MLKKLKYISPALYAWSRLFFYLAVALLMIAIPIAYLVCLFYNPALTLVVSVIIFSLFIYSGGKHGSFR
jgi:hypothetical protein